MKIKQIAILGSTGSIGRQTLQVISDHQEQFQVYAITANNSVDLLIEQALQFNPEVVCIANEEYYEKLKEALRNKPIKVYAGEQAIAEVVTMPSIDIVVAAMVGYAGLLPTIEAIKHSKTIALANKETLVVAGQLICQLAQQYGAKVIPVDSEHSAIFQCLAGEGNNQIEKILLTASGGPFLHFTESQLDSVTAAQALKHPNWQMGDKITIDSATMMNKGFEVIEAKWLFGVQPQQIQVVVHPQSIIHSMVQFNDGTVKAQLGMPDMRLPIQYALTYPHRLATNYPRIDFTQLGQLTFIEPDTHRFPCLQLAFDAIGQGGNIPCALNAANEVVNLAFRQNKITFKQISSIIEHVIAHAPYIEHPTYEDYVTTDAQTRIITNQMI